MCRVCVWCAWRRSDGVAAQPLRSMPPDADYSLPYLDFEYQTLPLLSQHASKLRALQACVPPDIAARRTGVARWGGARARGWSWGLGGLVRFSGTTPRVPPPL